jgi:hypothetical protein
MLTYSIMEGGSTNLEDILAQKSQECMKVRSKQHVSRGLESQRC